MFVAASALLALPAAAKTQRAMHRSQNEAGRLFRAGSAAYEAGRLQEAETDFRRLVALVPKLGMAHTALGTVLLQKGDSAGAVAELKIAHRTTPEDTQITVKLAESQQMAGLNTDAVGSFEEAVNRRAALTPEENLPYGIALSMTGRFAEAQQVLEAAASSAEPSAMALDALGAVLAQQGSFKAAEQKFQQALTADPSLIRAHAHLGSLLLRTDQPEPAASEFKKAIDLGDTSSVTQSQFGRALVMLGRTDEAVAMLEPAVKRNPSALDLLYALALGRQAAGDVQGSLQLFRQVTEQQPNNAEALTNYGLALVQNGNAVDGLRQYELARVHGGDGPLLRQNTGVAYLQQNDVDHALESFRAGLKASPDDVQLHYDLGLALKLKDDLIGATAELERAAALDPQMPDPHYTLGVLKMQQGDFAQAAFHLERVVKLQPMNGEAWALLGSVYKQAGDRSLAADALRRAIALQPAQPGPHITLATILSERGDREGASAERRIAGELSRAAVNEQRGLFALRSGRALLLQGRFSEALAQLQIAVTATPNSAEVHRALDEALQATGRTTEATKERSTADALDRSRP